MAGRLCDGVQKADDWQGPQECDVARPLYAHNVRCELVMETYGFSANEGSTKPLSWLKKMRAKVWLHHLVVLGKAGAQEPPLRFRAG